MSSPSRCCNGHLLVEVGYRMVNGRVVCLACARENAARHRKVVKRMTCGDPAYADRHAPSAEEVERKAAIIRAIIEDAHRDRYARRTHAIVNSYGLRTV